MPGLRRLLILTTLAVLALSAVPRHATADDPADVDALIELIRKRPSGMDEQTWKEKRRDAARELGRLGDPRAVPVLIEVVERETFDVIAEIAIEALGRLRDRRAVPALRAVYHDASRDRYVRDAARTALRRIGADPDGTGGDGGGGGDGGDGEGGGTGGGGGDDGARDLLGGGSTLLGDRARRDIPKGPTFEDDTLAVSEQLTFALGGVRLQYDTIRKAPSLDGDVTGSYRRTIEGARMSYSFGGGAAVTGGLLDVEGDDSASRAVTFDAAGGADARFYLAGGNAFAHIEGELAMSLVNVRVDLPDADDIRETQFGADIQAGLGGGYGRVFDVGEGLRLRRIEKVLAEARLLGRPITDDLARRIFSTWWALRNEQGAYRRLVATVQLLRDGGVLLGEPDVGTAYELLQVLTDGQLDHRLSGWDVRIGLAESYLLRDDDLEEALGARLVSGRVETVFGRATFARQNVKGDGELVAHAAGRYRIIAPDDDPSPWAVTAIGAWRNFFYSDAYDPIGALDIGVEVGASDDDIGDPDVNVEQATHIATRIGGTVGWTWIPNRASRFRLAAAASLESDELFVGVSFDASWGLLDAAFLSGTAMPPPIP